MTELNDKAIDIKGKKYVLVSDRILAFNAEYPKGSIVTELLSQPEAELVVMKATVYPQGSDQYIKFVGHSQAKWGDGYINKTSALENCETSAVGRALAMMGIGVIDSIASADEMVKAGATVTSQPTATTYPDTRVQEATGGVIYATDPQINAINKGIKEGKLGPEIAKEIPTMSKVRASQLISKMYGN